MISLSLIALAACSAGAHAASPSEGASPSLRAASSVRASHSERSISLTQEPLIMRLNKDEFRIVFGINGERCGGNGCSGIIRYRVDWKTQDGTTRSEVKHVNYLVSPLASRTIAVDRQYFDTAEGQHTTDVVRVSIDAITCLHAPRSRGEETARL
jgi:hypothetical protein